MFKDKRVLVTGATGLIGSHLIATLLDKGAIVIAYGRSEVKLKTVFAKYLENSSFSYVTGNISVEISEDISELDYIFHAASPISGTEIKIKPVDTIAANIDGTINCLEFLKNQGHGRMIVFSSATVYGNQFSENITVSEEETNRADALHTVNTPYSEAKRMIEVLARAYVTQYKVDSVIVRIGYVYGYSAPRPNTAFYEFIGNAINGETITVNNSGMGRRDNIHVDDVVRGLLLVAEKGMTGESYNLSSNGDANNFRAIDEMAEIIASAVNKLDLEKSVKTEIKPFEGERKPGMKLDNTKAKRLGWSITVGLEEGITETIKKYMK